jgi:hypothetical protein
LLEKHQAAQKVAIANYGHALAALLLIADLFDFVLHAPKYAGCYRIFGESFVIYARGESAIRANQRGERILDVGIDRSRDFESGLADDFAQSGQQILALPEELVRHTDIGVRQFIPAARGAVLLAPAGLFMAARVAEIFTIERTTHRLFAFGAAADGTNFAAHPRAEPLWAPNSADRATHLLSIRAATRIAFKK